MLLEDAQPVAHSPQIGLEVDDIDLVRVLGQDLAKECGCCQSAVTVTKALTKRSTSAADKPATPGLRRHQRHARSMRPVGRARIGSPAPYRSNSSARASAEP